MNKEKNWTIMIYFAADNNLEGAALSNLTDIKAELSKPGADDNIYVVAQFDPKKDGESTKRYNFNSSIQGSLDKFVVADRGETNTGSPEELVEFFKFGLTFPAQHYMLVLWGHGKGEDDAGDCSSVLPTPLPIGQIETGPSTPPAAAVPKPAVPLLVPPSLADVLVSRNEVEEFLNDDTPHKNSPPDFLNNQELQKALQRVADELGRKIDILGMDACLMGMIEIGCQVRASVDFMIASEQTVPNESWPYSRILPKLIQQPGLSPAQLATTIVNEYVAHYKELNDKQHLNVSVTMSACDMSKLDSVISGMQELALRLREGLADPETRKAIIRARLETQFYYFRDYIDLIDLCEKLIAACKPEAITTACRNLIATIESPGFVIANAAHSLVDKVLEASSHGLSIYFPLISPCYLGLDFPAKTDWDLFLRECLTGVLQRPPAQGAVNGLAKTPNGQALKLQGGNDINNSNTTESEVDDMTDVIKPIVTIRVPPNARLSRVTGDKVELGLDVDNDGGALLLIPAEKEISLPEDTTVKSTTGQELKVIRGTQEKVPGPALITSASGFIVQLPECNVLKLNLNELESLADGAQLEAGDGTPIRIPANTKIKGPDDNTPPV